MIVELHWCLIDLAVLRFCPLVRIYLLLKTGGQVVLVSQFIALLQGVGMDPQRREMAGYVCSQLEEILERCGVTIISGDSAFDESRHRPYPAVSRIAAGTAIVETLSP